jgi:hypothetical protein
LIDSGTRTVIVAVRSSLRFNTPIALPPRLCPLAVCAQSRTLLCSMP